MHLHFQERHLIGNIFLVPSQKLHSRKDLIVSMHFLLPKAFSVGCPAHSAHGTKEDNQMHPKLIHKIQPIQISDLASQT